MYTKNLKFVALPVPDIIAWAGLLPKIGQSLDTPRCLIHRVPGLGYSPKLGSPWIRHAPFSPKSLMSFCSDGPCECTGQI